MPIRYLIAVADATERAHQIRNLGITKAPVALRRDAITLDLIDPTTGIAYSLPIAGLSSGSFGPAGSAWIPGGALVGTVLNKSVAGLLDTVATDIVTVTVPNAKHAAIINLTFISVLGAGGTIGAGEGTRVSEYQLVLARTPGVAVVATLSAAVGGAEAHVAGAASVTSGVATLSAITGAVGATNTFTIKLAITKSAGASDNHVGVVSATIVNQVAAGVTIA